MARIPKFLPAVTILATLTARADGGLGVAFGDAAGIASRKLEDERCLLVLSDFSDASGRPLAERLHDTGLTAREFFERLEFRNGRHESTCQRSRVDAFVHIGQRTVFVCPGGCFDFGRRDVGHASNVLIHEMLHTLGLGENPPTSLGITSRVAERCGR
ncbi:MAG TPA: hypothetical protein VLJ18_06400 [Thermoanaerobaculia bacterium]|nr:hypothetical protein [Thermoanaerobaculia bacterium]